MKSNNIKVTQTGSVSLLLILLPCFALCQVSITNSLQELKETILMTGKFDAEKIDRINRLKQKKINYQDTKGTFDHYLAIYDEYAVFNFDSAYHYAKELQQAAYRLDNGPLISYAGMKINYVLLSAGMFKEVFESLTGIDPAGLDNKMLAEYYILKSRAYFDLADYNKDNIFSESYNKLGGTYLDSSLLFFPPNSFEYNYYSGLKNIRSDNVFKAGAYFQGLISDSSLSLRYHAIVYSTMSDIYVRRGMTDSVIILLVKAAIADIKSSTKETTAIFHLSNILSKEGDLENAALFIQKASEDARTYGARQRMLQLGSVLPIIEGKRLSVLRQQKTGITRYAFIITLLLVFLVIMSIIILRQVRRLKVQQKAIGERNLALHHLVEEKEWLIKEIHHRVKNNLHTITSLLESQSAYLRDEAFEALRDTQHRVFAMSLIHQKLYQPEKNVTKINMAVYIHELVNYLGESFQIGKRIRVEMELEPVHLDISLAVPLGIVLNEAITNSIKYAFPGNEKGVITVAIKKTGDTIFIFSVADDGIGLPQEYDPLRSTTLGMKLMKGLSDDIAANFTIDNKQGTHISIEFAVDNSLRYVQGFDRQH